MSSNGRRGLGGWAKLGGSLKCQTLAIGLGND